MTFGKRAKDLFISPFARLGMLLLGDHSLEGRASVRADVIEGLGHPPTVQRIHSGDLIVKGHEIFLGGLHVTGNLILKPNALVETRHLVVGRKLEMEKARLIVSGSVNIGCVFNAHESEIKTSRDFSVGTRIIDTNDKSPRYGVPEKSTPAGMVITQSTLDCGGRFDVLGGYLSLHSGSVLSAKSVAVDRTIECSGKETRLMSKTTLSAGGMILANLGAVVAARSLFSPSEYCEEAKGRIEGVRHETSLDFLQAVRKTAASPIGSP